MTSALCFVKRLTQLESGEFQKGPMARLSDCPWVVAKSLAGVFLESRVQRAILVRPL